MAKTFKEMNKEELIKATASLGLTDEVVASAKDPEKITNAEYVTVLEAFKAKQDELNADTKAEKESATKQETTPTAKGKVVDAFERAKLKQIKYKYIVTDHQNRTQIEDDDITRVFPIQYGNVSSGPKVWNVALHGNPQALPFSVAKRLEEIQMATPSKDAKGDPIMISQPRFRVTKVEGFTQAEMDELKRVQNTRVFKD